MTTEVLRNMLYAGSPALDGLGYVVMDEVHYLADRFRGAVWEEVIIHLPQSVTLVSLSATVSNAEEFGDWLVTVRGDTEVVVSEHRPVPLWQHMLVGNRMFDLFALRPAAHAGEQGDTPAASPPGSAAPPSSTPSWSGTSASTSGGSTPGTAAARRLAARRLAPAALPAAGALRRRRPAGPRRPAAGDHVHLQPRRLRRRRRTSACAPGCGSPTEAERAEIAEIVDRRTGSLPEEDLHVLGYWEWLEGLQRGLAAHHAGLLPAFKETVEECSSAAWSRRCSPPRPSRWASTCRRAAWCWSGWSSSTARRTST